MKKYIEAFFSFNRLVLITISAIMSYTFYSELAGSVIFYQVVFGVAAVCLDIKRVELWDAGGKKNKSIALLFVVVSVVGFAGNSIAAVFRDSIKSDNYVTSEYEKIITDLNEQAEIQTDRVKNTENNYGTAAKREADAFQATIDKKVEILQSMQEYKTENKNESTLSFFEVLSKITGISLQTILLFWYTFRAILLEIAILVTGKRKAQTVDNIQEEPKERNSEPISPVKDKIEEPVIERAEYKEAEPPEINEKAIYGILDRWAESAKESEKPTVGYKVNILREAIEKLLSFTKKDKYFIKSN